MFKGTWPWGCKWLSLSDKELFKTFLDPVGNLEYHQNLRNISLKFHQNLLIFLIIFLTDKCQTPWPWQYLKPLKKISLTIVISAQISPKLV